MTEPPRVHSFVKVGATVVVAGIIALCIVNNIPVPEPLPVSYAAAVQYVLDESLLSFAAWAAGFAFVGAVMRAGAQNGEDTRRGLDYAGKLCAVAAASLALWVALLSLPAAGDFRTRGWLVAAAAGATLLVLLGVLIVRAVNRKRTPTAAV
jgi:hypothetical protein